MDDFSVRIEHGDHIRVCELAARGLFVTHPQQRRQLLNLIGKDWILANPVLE